MVAMNGQWINRSQPPTLLNGVILLYVNGALNVLFGIGYLPILALGAAQVAGGFGIANEKKWGYGLGLVGAFGPLILAVGGVLSVNLLTLVFEIVLIVLLLHPQSREYQRIWFK
jgi:hypothetical protein